MPLYLQRAFRGVGEFITALIGVTVIALMIGGIVLILAVIFGIPLPGLLPENNGLYRTITGALSRAPDSFHFKREAEDRRV